MLKVEGKRTTMSGSGEELLLEYAMLTHSLKMALLQHDREKDEDFAEYLLFTAFKGGLDAPDKAAKFVGKHEKPEEKDYNPTPGEDFIKMLDDLIASIEKGD